MRDFRRTACAAFLFFCFPLTSCVTLYYSDSVQGPEFSLTSMPGTVTLVAGGAGQQVSVNAVAANGFTGMVTVEISGLPSGVTANPPGLTLVPGTAQNVMLTAASNAATGNVTVTLTGTSGALINTATVAATISAAPPEPEFSLTSIPGTVALVAGGSGQQVSVNAVPANGFTATVTVEISGLPSGVTANPPTLTLVPGTAQNVTLTAAANAAAGHVTVTFTGTSGALSHSATVTATISPEPEFSLTSIPGTVALVVGGSGQQVSVNAVPENGFTATVTVAISGLPSGVTANPPSLTLVPGTAQNVTLTAAANAAASHVTVTFTGTSGTLSHSSSVTLTVSAPPPDFSLTLTPPTSLTIAAGASGSPVSVNAVPINGFTATVAVTISGLPSGVTANPPTLTLTPGTAQSTTLTAASNAAAATQTVTFTGTSGTLTHTASLSLTVQTATPPTVAPDVTTYHYDAARDGLNAQETILTLSNVNSTQFGKIGFDTVDGLVDAEPLYLANVTAGGILRNVLYVATENDSVYAFDADSGAQILEDFGDGRG